MFASKLRSTWDGPLIVQQVFPSGAVHVLHPQDGRALIVNGERLKPIMAHDIEPGSIESINLVDSVYHD